MALNGSVSTSNYQGRYYYVNWSASQSIPNNGSTISWTLGCSGGTSSWYAERTLSVVVAGNTVVSKTDRVQRYAGTIASGSIWVGHNANGDASFSISIQAAVYGSSVNCTGSGSFSLNNIPRKSTLSVANGTLGTAQTLTVTRKSTSFSHTITYECGSYSGTICTKSTSTSISWTPILDFANGAPNGTSVYISLKIETFNGNTSIGSNSYSITCAIPTSVVPTVSFTVADAMGYLSTYSGYVQSKSKAQIAITAAGKYSSTITSYNTTIDGKTYTESSFTSELLNGTGTLTITVTITDSRGRTASASKTITVLAYSAPTISSFIIKRCNSSGVSTSSGAYLGVFFDATITSLNSKNTATYVVKYKKVNDSSYTTATVTTYSGKYSVSDGKYVFAADTASSYDVIFEATDAFSTSIKNGSGSSITKLFSMMKKGLGWAFGKVAEIENALEVAWDTYIRGDLQVDGNATLNGPTYVNATIFDRFGIPITNGLTMYTGSGSSGIDPDITLYDLIVTDRNLTAIGGGLWYIHTMFYSDKSTTTNRAQYAFPYNKSAPMYYRYYYNGSWSSWTKNLATTGATTTNGALTVALSETESANLMTDTTKASLANFSFGSLVLNFNGSDKIIADGFGDTVISVWNGDGNANNSIAVAKEHRNEGNCLQLVNRAAHMYRVNFTSINE